MQKLLETYRAAPTLQNAQKLRTYNDRHPMALCLLGREDDNMLRDAIRHANEGASEHAPYL